ncbi:MAG: hypothetical protein M1825_006395 [Sarcosagium campestre]|nr:MAG: hypothetical protein M1825_006395 [Sarcosagium campestre]
MDHPSKRQRVSRRSGRARPLDSGSRSSESGNSIVGIGSDDDDDNNALPRFSVSVVKSLFSNLASELSIPHTIPSVKQALSNHQQVVEARHRVSIQKRSPRISARQALGVNVATKVIPVVAQVTVDSTGATLGAEVLPGPMALDAGAAVEAPQVNRAQGQSDPAPAPLPASAPEPVVAAAAAPAVAAPPIAPIAAGAPVIPANPAPPVPVVPPGVPLPGTLAAEEAAAANPPSGTAPDVNSSPAPGPSATGASPSESSALSGTDTAASLQSSPSPPTDLATAASTASISGQASATTSGPSSLQGSPATSSTSSSLSSSSTSASLSTSESASPSSSRKATSPTPKSTPSSQTSLSASSVSGSDSLSSLASSTATTLSTMPSASASASATGLAGVGGAGQGTGTGAAATATDAAGVGGSSGGSSSGPATPKVVGGVIGGLAGFALLLVVFLLLLRRKKTQRRAIQPLAGNEAEEGEAHREGGQQVAERTSETPIAPAGFLRRLRPSSQQTVSTDTAPSERGFYRVSGRKIPPAIGGGGDGYGDDGRTLSETSFYDSQGFYAGSPSGPSAAPARPESHGDGRTEGVAVMRPSPARTPVTAQAPYSAFPTPPSGNSPVRRPLPSDALGRSHASLDGSRGSRFTEDVI